MIPSLFPDEPFSNANTENDDDAMMSYTGNFYLGSAGARARPTANELWLQRTHNVVQGGQGSSSSSAPSYPPPSSWMPAPSSSVNIRPTNAHRQVSVGNDVGPHDARRVRFAWGTPGGEDENDVASPSSLNWNNGSDNNNRNGHGHGYGGGRKGSGYGYGYGSAAAGSKRSWGGRHEVDGKRDDDENEEDTVDEEQERRARRRGR
jgi:hypothetical protein